MMSKEWGAELINLGPQEALRPGNRKKDSDITAPDKARPCGSGRSWGVTLVSLSELETVQILNQAVVPLFKHQKGGKGGVVFAVK